MKLRLPFVSRHYHERELGYVNADRERLRGERDQFAGDRDSFRYAAETAARQLADADATARRLHGRNLELGDRISELAEVDSEYTAQLERQLAAEKRRADRLQARLDDAVGLSPGRIEDSRQWQPGYQESKAGGC